MFARGDYDWAYTNDKHRRKRVRLDNDDGEEDENGDGGEKGADGDDKDGSSAGDPVGGNCGSGTESTRLLGKPLPNPLLSESDSKSRCFAHDNHIYFFSGVSKDSVYRLNDHLIRINANFQSLQRRNPTVDITPKPIYLHINSFGGGVFAAFAAVDFIQQSTIPVHTIVEGASASAATLMSVVGKRRYIRPHASMLIHELRSWFGGKMTEIDDEYKNIEQMHKAIKDIYIRYTGITEDRIKEIIAHDRWWTAERCIEEKLVDAIWTDGTEDQMTTADTTKTLS